MHKKMYSLRTSKMQEDRSEERTLNLAEMRCCFGGLCLHVQMREVCWPQPSKQRGGGGAPTQ